jgi:hypothetical protein
VYLSSNLEANPHYAHLRRDAFREPRNATRRRGLPSPVSTVLVGGGPQKKSAPKGGKKSKAARGKAGIAPAGKKREKKRRKAKGR